MELPKFKNKEDELQFEQEEALPLMEAFYTLQGEGHHTGKAAYFIRLGGCDVGCHWCDVKESWNPQLHPLTKVDSIIQNVLKENADTVVITGGEPSAYNLNYICSQLKKNNISVHIETSASYALNGVFDWVCLSPKRTAPPLEINLAKANELKIIVYNNADFKWAEEYSNKVSKNCMLFLQPEWSKCEKLLPEIIEYIKLNPKWRISLQAHKYMNIP